MRAESINTQEAEECKIVDVALQGVTTTTKLQVVKDDPVQDRTLHQTIMHKPVEDIIMRQAEKDLSWIESSRSREKEQRPNVSMM